MTGTDPTNPDRRLLAEVSRWAHANGWNLDAYRWTDADDTISISIRSAGFELRRRNPTSGRYGPMSGYIADSPRQAIDLLVALDILPVQFSSAYAAGVIDGAGSTRGYDSAVAELAAAARDVIAAGRLTRNDSDDPDAERGRAHSRLIAAESGWLREYAKQVTR